MEKRVIAVLLAAAVVTITGFLVVPKQQYVWGAPVSVLVDHTWEKHRLEDRLSRSREASLVVGRKIEAMRKARARGERDFEYRPGDTARIEVLLPRYLDLQSRAPAAAADIESKLAALKPPSRIDRWSGWSLRWAWQGEPWRLHWPLFLLQQGLIGLLGGGLLTLVVRRERRRKATSAEA